MYTTTEAFILNSYNLKETDKIIIFYSKDIGKIKAVAKGVRKGKSKLAASLELFTYIDLTVYRKQQDKFFVVTETKIKDYLSKIKKDFRRIVYGNYLVELVDKLTGEEEANKDLFNLIKSFLFLMQEKDAESILWCFVVRILDLLGYKMCLDVCAFCRGKVQPFKNKDQWKITFSPKEGGIICNACIGNNNYVKYVSPGIIEIMKKFQKMDLDKLDRLKFSDTMREELSKTLYFFLSYYLPEELRTQQFMKKVSNYKIANMS